MRDLLIGARRQGQPRPWRAAVIGVGLVAAAGVVAWFIFERSVTYEAPDGEASGAVQWLDGDDAGGATGAGGAGGATGAAGGATGAPGAPMGAGSAAPGAPTGAGGAAPSGAAAGALRRGPGSAGALVYRGARLEWRGGIAVLHVAGTGHDLGAAHGRLLAEQVPIAAAVAQPAIDGLVRGAGSWARLTHQLRVDWRMRFLDDGLGDVDRATVAGMVRGADLPEERYQDLLRAQAIWDIGAPTAAGDAAALARALAVAAPQAGPGTGRFWLGHVFGAPGLDDGGESLAPVVTLARPAHGLAWAALGWPGAAGVATGMNARGIAVLVNPARTRDVRATRSARPILLVARAVLEQAETLDEAVRLLENSATLGAASYLVVDGRAGKGAVVERSPARAVVTRLGGALAIGDYLTAQVFTADPENDRTRRISPSAGRVARAQELLRAPLASVEQLAAVLRDRRTRDDIARPLGHRGVPFDVGAQVAILDPSMMALWVADPTAAGRMRAFDLRHELEGLGDRPAPPPDIPADATLELGALSEVRAARRSLRAARRALEAGSLVKARQLADRAVTRAPSLPEALLLAGELAAAAGDHAAARRLLQRWLDGGPDDPEHEPKVRAQLSSARGW
jgi:hypothetical protein